ncbi:MAG: hypothetical protein LBR70_01760 [Lactobacillaceae bacterium]|jgi:hypothetical protein|nr:hypothetical protein [Lactobacillaceae bacterium]
MEKNFNFGDLMLNDGTIVNFSVVHEGNVKAIHLLDGAFLQLPSLWKKLPAKNVPEKSKIREITAKEGYFIYFNIDRINELLLLLGIETIPNDADCWLAEEVNTDEDAYKAFLNLSTGKFSNDVVYCVGIPLSDRECLLLQAMDVE